MRKATLFLLILVPAVLGLLLARSAPLRAGEDATVLYPPDLTLATEETIKVYEFHPDGGLPTFVKHNGKVVAKLEGEEFRSGELTLAPGMNLLEVGPERKIRVYYIPNAKMEQFRFMGESGREKMVFSALRLHPALEDGCDSCHGVKAGKIVPADQKEACYSCHTSFEEEEEGKEKVLHDPVANGECTSCHDPHFAALPKLQKSEKGCLECHDAFEGGGSVHYPVKDGECVACHGPHFGYAAKQLLRPGNSLCLGCHDDPHPRHRSADVKGVLTTVPEDFPREKDQLACLGCHLPHASAERRLFRIPQGEMCKSCHKL